MSWVLCRKQNRRELLRAQGPVTRAKHSLGSRWLWLQSAALAVDVERAGKIKETEPAGIGD